MESIADDSSRRIAQQQRRRPESARPEGATLAEHHGDYLEARAVARDGGGMFWTARRPAEIPPVFSERQRRGGCTLIAEFCSPDGETVGWQKRDDRPKRDRRGRIAKWMSPPGDRARPILGVAPLMLDEVREGTGPLWIVEGPTRGAVLERWGIPAVVLAGVWNGFKDGEPLPCWSFVNLRGRLVLVAFDADARTNENVQMALAQLVGYLESRGARPLVVDVPEIDGDEHTGLDDALARGASPYALQHRARPFVRVDVSRERLQRDEQLRRFVAAKLREVEGLPARTVAECNAVKVARHMVGAVARHGKADAGGGVVVHPSFPQIAEATRLGSFQTVRKALDRLESAEFLERRDRRTPKEATSYLLLDPSGGGSAQGVNIGTRGSEGREGQEHKGRRGETSETPHYQRDSYLCLHSTHRAVKSAAGAEKVPALRNSKLVHTWARRDGRRVVVDSDYIRRYGAKREEIFRYVLERGGADDAELWEKFGSPTSRLGGFLKTWLAPMLEDGVLVADGEPGSGRILPAPDWPEALERVRARTDEETDNRLQSEKYARQRKVYRGYLERLRRGEDPKADPTPELNGPEHTTEALQRNAPEWERRRVESEREKVGTTAAVFVADELEGAAAVRWREMRERWAARGGRGEDLRRAVHVGPFRFDREADGWLYVYPREAPAQEQREPAGVTPLYEAPAADPHDPGGDWRDHALDCPCLRCVSPAPSYASAWSAS